MNETKRYALIIHGLTHAYDSYASFYDAVAVARELVQRAVYAKHELYVWDRLANVDIDYARMMDL